MPNKSWRWAAVGLVLWFVVNLVFVFFRLDWIRETNSEWYWSIARNLDAFDPAVTVGYPAVWRAMTMLLPGLHPNTAGQIISLLAYVLTVPVVYTIFRTLRLSFAWQATLLVALFPLVGVTSAVPPRTNALLALFTFLAILAYLQDRRWLLILTVAILPLLHRSVLPLLAVLLLVGISQRKINWWMLLPMGLPFLLYWFGGFLKYGDPLWYFGWYAFPDVVLGLPLADGLLGTIYLGLRGSLPDLLQAALIVAYWLLALFLLATGVWRARPFLLALILPVIILGLILPADEIWSAYNYTSYLVIPLALYLEQKNYRWLHNRPLWFLILAACFLSQIVWAVYSVAYVRA